MEKVKIVDSIMGKGKTSWAIQYMQELDENTKVIYISPFLEELDRVKAAVTGREFYTPDVKHGSGTKLQSFKRLVTADRNILTSHALFSMVDRELVDMLRVSNYILIADRQTN